MLNRTLILINGNLEVKLQLQVHLHQKDLDHHFTIQVCNLSLLYFSNLKIILLDSGTVQNVKDLFDIIISQAMYIPGFDPTYGSRVKKPKVEDEYLPVCQNVARALIPYVIITHYNIDTSNPVDGRKRAILGLIESIEEIYKLFSGKQIDLSIKSVMGTHFETSSFKEYFVKHYRQCRTEISKNWIKIFYEKPSGWIRNTLKNDDIMFFDNVKSNYIYPFITPPEERKIFGMIG
jgi:hypothetical protein